MQGVASSYQRNTTFALPKNSNLLPDHGKENPARTTFDNQLIELESVDSTNNYAMGRIHEDWLSMDGPVWPVTSGPERVSAEGPGWVNPGKT